MSKLQFFILTILLIFAQGIVSHDAKADDLHKICGSYYYKQSKLLHSSIFGENEKILICGDDKTKGWQNISRNQALYQIGVILEDNAYYNWTHKVENKKTVIDLGKKVKLKNIKFENAPEGLGEVSYKGVQDKPLTPALLGEIEKWTTTRASALGYACAKVKSQAFVKEALVKVNIQKGKKYKVGDIKVVKGLNLEKGALTRFYAINKGDPYNGDYFNLTSRRLEGSGIVNYSYFSFDCENANLDILDIKHKAVLEKPKSLTIAFGASTEELPLIKSKWRHNALDDDASSVVVDLHLSNIKQTFGSELKLYFFNQLPRLHFFPRLELERISEEIYTTFFQRYKIGSGYNLDTTNYLYKFQFVPTFNIENTTEGFVRDKIQFLSLNTEITLMDHYYEYFRFSPRIGSWLSFKLSSKQEGFGSDSTGNLFEFSGKHLYNLGAIDPPIFIMALRYDLKTVKSQDFAELPQAYRIYLGGADNIRGFSRKELNNKKRGYKSSAYFGLEGRFADLLPYKIQPLVLFDFAKVGEEEFNLASPVLYSPGAGLRWESPIGTFYTTAARGYVKKSDVLVEDVREEWNFFLSYGKEF